MIFGLPVTGLGGLFYLILTIMMPLHEAHRTVRGRGCPKRWKQIGVSCAMMAGLFITMFSQAWLLNKLMPSASALSSHALGTVEFDRMAGGKTGGLVAGAMIISLFTLVIVAALVHTLRFALHMRAQMNARPQLPVVAAATAE